MHQSHFWGTVSCCWAVIFIMHNIANMTNNLIHWFFDVLALMPLRSYYLHLSGIRKKREQQQIIVDFVLHHIYLIVFMFIMFQVECFSYVRYFPHLLFSVQLFICSRVYGIFDTHSLSLSLFFVSFGIWWTRYTLKCHSMREQYIQSVLFLPRMSVSKCAQFTFIREKCAKYYECSHTQSFIEATESHQQQNMYDVRTFSS